MDLLKKVVETVEDVKVSDIKIYETKTITPLFDYVVIATASSSRQTRAVVEHLRDDSVKKSFNIKGIEGTDDSTWLLVDLDDVLVNVFIEEERERYALDKLWKDLPQVELENLL